jgi:predicted CopG family antitoxin
MQIDIDFDVFKALTALRQSEIDSYNDVLRRVLLIA